MCEQNVQRPTPNVQCRSEEIATKQSPLEIGHWELDIGHFVSTSSFTSLCGRCYLFVFATLVCLFSGCAGYQLGATTLFRPDIRTVYVPMFESDSFRRNLGEWMTEAVVKEIERKSSYKVVSDPALADSVLTGRIVLDSKRILAETINDDARNVEVDLVVQVNWVDRRGEAILPGTSFSLAQQGFNVAENASYIPEAGQSVTSANQKIVSRIAQEIVAQMEAPW